MRQRYLIILVVLQMLFNQTLNSQTLARRWTNHPDQELKQFLKEGKLKAALAMPDSAPIKENDRGDNLGETGCFRLFDKQKVKQFSTLFINETTILTEIPERIPPSSGRNSLTLIFSNSEIIELIFFRYQEHWIFMVRWQMPEDENRRLTVLWKSTQKFTKWMESNLIEG